MHEEVPVAPSYGSEVCARRLPLAPARVNRSGPVGLRVVHPGLSYNKYLEVFWVTNALTDQEKLTCCTANPEKFLWQ